MFLWRKALVLLALFVTWFMFCNLVYVTIPAELVVNVDTEVLCWFYYLPGCILGWYRNVVSAAVSCCLFEGLGISGGPHEQVIFPLLDGLARKESHWRTVLLYSGRSLIYRGKSVGPWTLPWGTPDRTGTESD